MSNTTLSTSSCYPYKQIPFQNNPMNKAYESYGYLGLERNISLLKDNSFPIEEKIKSIQIINKIIISPEMKSRAIKDYKIIDSIIYLFTIENNKIDKLVNKINCFENCCKLIENLITMSYFKKDLKELLPYLLKIINGTIYENTKLKHSSVYRDKIASCYALLQFSNCNEGVNLLLDYHVIEQLIETLKLITNENLMEIICKVLSNCCEYVPKARDCCANLNIVKNLNSILDLYNIYSLSLIESTCLLIWNISLDGDGKKLSKEIIPNLNRVLEYSFVNLLQNSLQYELFKNILNYTTGAISSILVNEDAKELMLVNCNENNTLNGNDICCKVYNEFNLLENINNDIFRNLENVIILASELPKNRIQCRSLLKNSNCIKSFP
ncbi:hypothetical protein ABK040_008302 [Willaertia magna]